MSEVSLEAQSGKTSGEDPQLDCEEEEEDKEANIAVERLSEDVKQESVDGSMGGDDGDEVMYEIDIDSAEENVETSDNDIREVDQGSQSEHVVTCDDGEAAHMSGGVDNGAHETDRHAERAEAPEDSGEAHTEAKVIFSFTLDNQPLQAAPCCALVHVAVFIFMCFGGGDGGTLSPSILGYYKKLV